MIAYFDTQTFDHIYKKIGCTGADIANLRKAIYGRQLSVRLSIHTLEEILLGRKVSPQALAAQIKLTLSVASSRILVKSCSTLLLDDIRAYSDTGQPQRPFLSGDTQNAVAEGISTLIETDGEEMEEEFLAVLDQTRQEKQQFFAIIEQTRRIADKISKPAGESMSFEQYLDAASLPALQALAERAGTDNHCGERDLRRLLKMKSVRMSIGAALAPSFDELASDAVSSGALHHAVAAVAVAQTYVTESAAIRQFLSRIPVEGLDVISLTEFLKQLG
ncbi:MAG: hypothetical protein JO166_19025 [Deltaproteobacteria bacterium]|nr:hypothetical protein [Deltaproteobacteria bacterium]